MKAEEETVAFMFFSVVMQFLYSMKKNHTKNNKKKRNLGIGRGWRGTRAEGQEGR